MAVSPCESDDWLRERIESYEEQVASLTFDIDHKRRRIDRLNWEIDELKTKLARRASAAELQAGDPPSGA